MDDCLLGYYGGLDLCLWITADMAWGSRLGLCLRKVLVKISRAAGSAPFNMFIMFWSQTPWVMRTPNFSSLITVSQTHAYKKTLPTLVMTTVAVLSLCSCSRFAKTFLSRKIEQCATHVYTPRIHAHVYPYCLASTFCFETWTRFWPKLLFWATLSGMFLHWGIPSDRAFIALHEILFHLLIWGNLFRKGVQPSSMWIEGAHGTAVVCCGMSLI